MNSIHPRQEANANVADLGAHPQPPISIDLDPMLARLSRELPAGDYLYEPKWDGFRCLAFREGDDIDLRSRNHRPLARYFPELVEALAALDAPRFVLDGEIVATRGGRLDFPSLLTRLHPAASRVERLRHEAPAAIVTFDLVACDDEDLRAAPFAQRRRTLEAVLAKSSAPLFLTPMTADPTRARHWLRRFDGHGLDGVVAKRSTLRYEPGRRQMVKVKRERTADCVVGGFRVFTNEPLPSSLLLGLYEGDVLHHVGVASSFDAQLRRSLLAELLRHATTLDGHPWESGFLLGGSPLGRLRGAAARWSPDEMDQDWIPLVPTLVCEVAYGQVDDGRFRHPARFRRWRPDRDARSCRMEQLGSGVIDLREVVTSA